MPRATSIGCARLRAGAMQLLTFCDFADPPGPAVRAPIVGSIEHWLPPVKLDCIGFLHAPVLLTRLLLAKGKTWPSQSRGRRQTHLKAGCSRTLKDTCTGTKQKQCPTVPWRSSMQHAPAHSRFPRAVRSRQDTCCSRFTLPGGCGLASASLPVNCASIRHVDERPASDLARKRRFVESS